MNNVLKYKGFTGTIEVSLQDHCLYGRVESIEDLVLFEGNTFIELEYAFKEAIDDYIVTRSQIDGSYNFKREERYLVLKFTDVRDALTSGERDELMRLSEKVHNHRLSQGKSELQAVIVEHDWPEYEKVWKMIEERVNGNRS